MKTSHALVAAALLVLAGAIAGYWWPQIWALILLVAPILTLQHHANPPTQPPPRPDYDDKDAVELAQDAAQSDNDYRAAIRRAKAARARLRRRLDGDGGGAGGGRDGQQ